MGLANLFLQIVSLSLMGSIFALVILLIKAIFRKKLSGKFHYYIWFLPVLKLTIPLNLQPQLNTFKFINNNSQKYDISSVVNQNLPSITNLNTNKAYEVPAPKYNYAKPITVHNTFNFKTASLIWFIGMLLIISYIIFVNIMLLINIRRNSICNRHDVNDILKETKLKLGINSKIPIICSNTIKSPAVYGIIHPKILISQHVIDRLSLQELKFIFLHELIHIKRKDLIINVVIMLLQVIYWFNPLILYALYEFKQDCELACDATALSVLDFSEIRKYGETIITMLKILSKPNLFIGTLGFSSRYSKRRIIMISSFNKKSITSTVIALCLIFMAGCSSTSKTLTSNLNNTTNTANATASSNKNATNTSSSSTPKNSVINSNNSEQNSNSQNILLKNIKNSASQGKIINSDFAVYTTSIKLIEAKLGKADREDSVSQIKNSKFYTYSKYNVVFGVKRGQVFEVRSFDSRLSQLSLSMVRSFFGNPAYNVTVNGEKIIGYTTLVIDTKTHEKYKVKIEFVFSKSSNDNSNPILNHYFVLDPRSTADDMANDSGIQW